MVIRFLNVMLYTIMLLVIAMILASIAGCQRTPSRADTRDRTVDPVMPTERACTIIKHKEFTQVQCADGTEEIIEHAPGTIEEVPDTGTPDEFKEQIPEVCTVIPIEEGAEVRCSDGSAVIIRHGKDGVDGQDGKDGKDGEKGDPGADGKDGQDGKDGRDGTDGEDALPCTVTDHEDGGVITCPDGSEVLIKDGKVFIKPGKGKK